MRCLGFISLILIVATVQQQKPIREGYAIDYSCREDSSPGIVFIATTRRGLTLSDTRDPKILNAWLESLKQPAKPFYIVVFTDHITATDTQSNTTTKIPLRNVVQINWRK